MSTRRHIWAIFLVFFFQSAVLGNWIPRIPDIKENLQIDSFTLGLGLLALSFGSMLAFFYAGSVTQRFGLRRTCQIAVPVWAVLFIGPGLAANAVQLFVALFLCGVAMAHCEVAMNTIADRIEHGWPHRIMSRCHGFWSLGSLFGAVTGAACAQFGISVQWHFGIVMPLLAVAGLVAATQLPDQKSRGESDDRSAQAGDTASVFRLPHKSILMLCIMPIGVMCVEGAFIDWSAVFMRTILDAGPVQIGIAYAFFSLIMAITRLFGDQIVERFGDYSVARVSALSASLGVLVFALSVNPLMAFIGAALAGLGTAVVYPIAMSAVAARPGVATDNVASLSLVSFSAFLMAPPLTGFIADLFSLRVSLALLAPVAATTWWLAYELKSGKLESG